MMHFTVSELELLIEALERAASRHESMARYYIGRIPRSGTPHDKVAADMRKLRNKLQRQKMEAA